MRVVIIDGNNIYARAWFACSKKHKPSIPEVVTLCKKLLGDYKAEFLASKLYVCWDGSQLDTERLKLYPNYKKRESKPEFYYQTLKTIRDLVGETKGFINIHNDLVEADDYIGLIARYYDSPNNDVFIITNDKDIYQVISKNVVIIRPGIKTNERLMDLYTFKQMFGFAPKFFTDYYCMVGDSSDNIEGAKGIGKVKAQKLVAKYGDIENIYSNIDSLAPALQKSLINSIDNMRIYKKIMTLKKMPLMDWMVF